MFRSAIGFLIVLVMTVPGLAQGQTLAFLSAEDLLRQGTERGETGLLDLSTHRGAQHLALEQTPNRLRVQLGVHLTAGSSLDVHRTGTVSGLVTRARTGEPVSGAQVQIVGTGIGAITDGQGRFEISQVPAGETEVQVQVLGYSTMSRTVNVPAGGVATVNFELAQEALALDEMVVTGVAGQARRREVGNTISQINIADVVESPVSVDALLQGRAAGVTVLQSTGLSGSGSQIRLRGNVSASLSNQPLIYIDGVRVRGDGYPTNVGDRGSRGPNDRSSPLNDINPSDIERVEIVKGAAATTLYGTEAAAGVIQIFTRSGAAGTPVWTAEMDQGVNTMRPFAPSSNPYVRLEPWLRNAHRQSYSLSIRGGVESVGYFVSGTFSHNQGVLPNDYEEKYMLRSNVNIAPTDNLQLRWNTSFTNTEISNTPSGNNGAAITLNAFRGDQNLIGTYDREQMDRLLDYEIFNYIDRFITGLTATHTPVPWLSNRLTVGLDRAGAELRNVQPFGYIQLPQGAVANTRWTNTTVSLDYVGTVDSDLTSALRGSLSWGGQFVDRETNDVFALGLGLPGPGTPTVSSAATRQGHESREKVVTGGFFLQTLFDLHDRYFLTAGVRVDGNSAFGTDFGWQPYPKVSLSYVISDEDFWPEGLGQVKLRGAYGHAGRAPGAFDAVRTWNPAGYGGLAAFRPANVGNPDLGPERTAELEFGFDASFLEDRLVLDVTYYAQRTTDALFNVRQVPSDGFVGSQLMNVGTMQNRGLEVTANADVLQRGNFTWELGLNVATNHSEVLDMGGAPEFSLGSNGFVEEGHPVPVMRGTLIRNADQVAEPDLILDHHFGPNLPTLSLGPSTTLHLPRGMLLTARGEYMGGHYIRDHASSNALSRSVDWPTCTNAYALIEAGRENDLTARERSWCIASNVRADMLIYPSDFFKVREVSFRTPLPSGDRFQSLNLTLSARNIWTWKHRDFPIFDPEMTAQGGMEQSVRAIGEQLPAPASLTASIRAVF